MRENALKMRIEHLVELNLTASDLSDLSHNRMLNDGTIQTFQQMLKIQQDPALGQASIFAL